MHLRRQTMLGMSAGVASLVLSACGFKLRGATILPFTSLWTSFAATSAVGNEFKRTVRASNPQLRFSDTKEDAQVVLNVLSESKDKIVLGLSSTGVIREYQLIVRMRFELLDGKGLELSPVQEIALKRDVTTNDAQLVAKEREDELLFREMQTDLVQQLMRRLAAVRRST